MTVDEFKSINVGDIILARSDIEITITDIQGAAIHYTTNTTGSMIHKTQASEFGYVRHISKHLFGLTKSLGKPRSIS